MVKVNDEKTSSELAKVEEYLPLKYEPYEIEYEKGYNKGDARFETIEKG